MQSRKQDMSETLSQYPITANNESERKLLSRYLDRKRDDLDQLEHAIERKDFSVLQRIGHNLAGSGAAYGLLRISVLGRQIEEAAESRSTTDAAATVAELSRFVSRIAIKDST